MKPYFLFLFLLPFLQGCTFAPPLSHSGTIAEAGNITDAGIIRPLYTRSGVFDGWLVRQWAVNDYNARLAKVGAQLTPPIKPGAGITKYGSFWKMTGEARTRWAELAEGLLQ